MNRRLSHVIIATFLAAGLVPGLNAQAHNHEGHNHQDQEKHEKHEADHAQAEMGDPYTLSTDPVTGEALPEVSAQVKVQHEGRELRFASKENHAKFKAAPDEYLNAIDEKIIAQQIQYYPIETCVVSNEPLGEKPVDFVYRNRLVRLCCKGCRGDFLKDPDTYLQKLDAAVIAKQSNDYPLTTCPVSKQSLGSMGDPIDVVIANRLIRLCCAGCKAQLLEDPVGYMATLDTPAEKTDPHTGHKH